MPTRPLQPGADASSARGVGGRRQPGDRLMGGLTHASAAIIALLLAMVVLVVVVGALPAIRTYGLGFLTQATYQPNEREETVRDAQGKIVYDADGEAKTITIPASFGAAPFIYGTAVSSGIALLVAVPLSLGASLFVVRVAPRLRLAGVLGFLIEFLAAIPSIAYGIWGIFVLRPVLESYVEPALRWCLGDLGATRWMFERTLPDGSVVPLPLTGRDMFAGGLILAIMIVPIITAVSRDVLRTVPRAQIEGVLALGGTWWQSCTLMLRFGRAGLFGAVMLGLARAAGETMAVTMVIGNVNQIQPSPFSPAQTMSSLLASDVGDVNNPLHFASLFYIALVLLVMSLAFNVIARWLVIGSKARTFAA